MEEDTEPTKFALEEKSGHVQTAIPFGLNRYVYVGSMIVLLLFWGPLILSWDELQGMLEKEGVYLWFCDDSNENRIIKEGVCVYQQAVLGQIGIFGSTMYCLGALLGGFVVDHFGPKVSTLCGGACNLLAYLMLAIGSRSVKSYFAFGIFLGFSVELVFLGTVSSPNLFPERKQLVLSLLAMARSASMLLCLAMNKLRSDSYTVKHIAYTYLGISAVIFVLVAFLIPSTPFTAPDELLKLGSSATADAEPPQKAEALEGELQKDDTNIDITEDSNAISAKKKGAYRLWARTLGEPFYLLWVICDSLLLVRCNFHIVSLSTQHPRVVTAFGIMAGVGFVFCPFIGWLLDAVGSLPVIFVLNCFGTMGFVSLLLGSSMTAQVFGLIGISVVLSYSGTQNFALMTEFYSQELVGKLTGLVTFIGGLLTLTNIPFWNWAKLNDKWKAADAIFLTYSGVCTVIIAILWWSPSCLFKNICTTSGASALRPSKKRH